MTLTGNIKLRLLTQVATAFLLLVSFALSRWMFWRLGVRFGPSTFCGFYQCLDLELLRTNLWSALLNLHSQPPGYNLMLGLAAKACPESTLLCLQWIYLALGFSLYASVYGFLRLSNFSRLAAMLAALAFINSPSSILYENWLFYTYPVAVLLVLAAVMLRRFLTAPHTATAAAFLLLCAGACLTRSAFHLVFILACVPFALIPRSASRRRIAVWAVCAVLLVTSLYVKNLSRFGFFGSSSWSGMNLFRIAAYSANARSVKDCVQPKRIPSIGSVVNLAARSPGSNTLNRLVQEGRLSRVAAIMPFSKITAYPEAFRTQLWHRVNAPELTEPYRKWGQNMNHEAYVSVSREYQTASTYIIRHHPRQYAAAVFDSWLLYGMPSWHYDFLTANVGALSRYIELLSWTCGRDWIVDLQPLKQGLFRSHGPPLPYPVAFLVVLLAVLLGACVRSAVFIHRSIRQADPSGLAFVFMTMTVMYVAVVGNAVEIGENNRFRVETDPLIFLLAVVMARDLLCYVARRWKCGDGERPSSPPACSATGEGMGSKQEAESTCAASCLRRIDFKITDQRKMVGVGDLRQFEVGDANPGTV